MKLMGDIYLKALITEAYVSQSLNGSHTGFIQKNPFKIYKLFTNLFHEPNVTGNAQTQHDAGNMARRSNTKVCNSSAHPVKGRNP